MSQADPHTDLITPSRQTWVGCLLISLVSLTLLSVRLFDTPVLMSANDRSRWCTVWSLVEKGTFIIDEIRVKPGWDSIDKVFHEEHYYSSKPPFVAVLVAPVYWLVKSTTGWNLTEHTQDSGHLILWLINIIPLAVSYWIWAKILSSLKLSPIAIWLMQTIFCFATLILPFATTLNNHLPGALSTLFCLYFYLKIEPGKATLWNLAWCGFWAGMMFAFELPAACLILFAGLMLLRTNPRKTLLAYAPSAFLVVAIYLAMNVVATGDIRPFYSYYGTEKYLHEVAGIPSYWADPKGVDRAPDSFPVYLLHCTIGHHGIFSLTPIWLMLFPALIGLRRQTQQRLFEVGLLTLSVTLVVFGFYMTKTEHYNFGGVTVALRWLVWLIPMWLVTLAGWLSQVKLSRSLLTLWLVLLVPSIISAWNPWIGPWRHPWLFQVMDKAGWIDQYREKVTPFEKPLKTWFTSLPSSQQQLPYWALYRSVDVTGQVMTMKLEVTSVLEDRIELTRTMDGQSPLDFTLSRSAFESGEALPAMLSNNADPSLIEFLRGFVAKAGIDVGYRPGFHRYLKLPYQNNYIRCQRSAAETKLRLPESGIWVASKCDLWLTDQVPFGTAQFVTTLTELTTGEPMSRRLWPVLDHSGLHPPVANLER